MNNITRIKLILPPNSFKLIVLTLCVAWSISACNKINSGSKVNQVNKNNQGVVNEEIKNGSRLASSNKDSVLIVSKKLSELYKLSSNASALVYAQHFEAVYLWQSSKHTEAMALEVKALADAERLGAKESLPDIYNLMGNLHKESSNYILAFQSANLGYNAAVQNKDTAEIISLLGLQAMLTRTQALKKHQGYLDTLSVKINLKALAIAESNPEYGTLLTTLYDNISQYYQQKEMFDKAIIYGDKGVANALNFNQPRSLTYSYTWLGLSYYYKGDHTKGIDYLNKALELTKKLRLPYREMEMYGNFYNCYNSSANYKEAIPYINRSLKMRDSLNVANNARQMSELLIKYKDAQKDQTILGLNRDYLLQSRQILWVLAVLVFLTVIGVIVLFQYMLIRRKNKEVMASNILVNEQSVKLQNLMRELHHRVKNNLQIVSSLLLLQSNRLTDEEARNAFKVGQQRIEAMSLIHRSLYQQENPTVVNMKDYVTDLVESIMTSFGINPTEFDLQLDIQVVDMDIDTALPLGLIINEWVTNAFKHAYNDMLVKPALWLKLKDGDKIELEIKDNGPGMQLQLWDKPQKSFGMKLVKVLAKQLGGQCTLDTESGTTMTLQVPATKLKVA